MMHSSAQDHALFSVSRLVLIVAVAGLAASCSGSNIRLSGAPMFASSSGSQPTPLAPIESRELPPAAVVAGSQVSTPAALKAKGYTVDNAPIIEVGAADTVMTLSQGYAVPVPIILEANGLISPEQMRPGQRLVIPAKLPPANFAPSTDVAGGPRIPADDIRFGAPPTTLGDQAAERRHLVQPNETLYSISTTYGVSKESIAALNGLPPDGTVRLGETLRIPATQTLDGRAPTEVASIAPQTAISASPEALSTPPANQALAPSAASAPAATEAPAVAPVDSATGFRWPVQGRIIIGFGKQADGARNDGINLAVPAGTPVRAAESGTVIYAGNELEGYGNLILVQHENDWVSAYAHNEAIKVSRGDKVERGQAIAKAGKTGSVEQPQLHFELRKNSRPVDPLPHLAGA